MNTVRAIRGMPDILPGDAVLWRRAEACCESLFEAYGYGELRLPLLESTALFSRSIGEVTDIVEKEMYSFDDRNGDSITLRPEGTASCVRAAIQHSLLATVPCRLWYGGPMFRYERPQKGRQRQFHQLGAELFGVPGPDAEAELLLMLARLWRELAIDQVVRLELNSLGSQLSRQRYREALVEYLAQRTDALDEDSRRRLDSNPLRILDSKVPQTQALLDEAPALDDYLDDAARAHRDRLEALLEAAGLAFRRNPRLVRGLDYYNDTVFEWTTDALGAQGTVCAGGRYDGLVAQLGGRSTPAAGFALGLERLVLLLREGEAPAAPGPDLFAVAVGEAALPAALCGVEALRDRWPRLRAQFSLGGGSFRSQLKRADRSGAAVALIWGEDEVAAGTVTLKPLRGNGEQCCVAEAELAVQLAPLLAMD